MEFLNDTGSIFILTLVGIFILSLIIIGIIFTKLYQRATKETSFVRTGLGGEKVVKDGGAIVLPVLHEIIRVSMNTLRIEVEKTKTDALITRDRMRVDVKADFYLRVSPDTGGISMAAQTLGIRTTKVEELKVLMESKFVDVLRTVAAEMSMTEMHEKRADFVQRVQNSVSTDLEKNGLELESVSLTGFDQTDLQFFNENNAFDAEGRARLAAIIEEKRKETNDIEQQNRILIEQRNLEAEKQSLQIKQYSEEASLEQEKSLQFQRQSQKAEIAVQREEKGREEQVAKILSEKAIESAEIEKTEAIETREIKKRQSLEQAAIQQQQAVEVSEQDKKIAIAQKSEEESAARANAADAELISTEKEEAVITTREVAEANRRKEIEVIGAQQEAEREAVSITTSAKANREAAELNAEAILSEAKATSDAKVLQAHADEKVLTVEAAGKDALYTAENKLKAEQIDLQKALAILRVLPQVVENSVKPLENIDGIKILQGFGGTQSNANQGASGQASPGSNMADQVTNAALSYRMNAPLVDSLLQELGVVGPQGNLNDLIKGNSPLTQINDGPQVEMTNLESVTNLDIKNQELAS